MWDFDICVIDTEYTRDRRIWEIGIFKLRDLEVVDEFDAVVDPQASYGNIWRPGGEYVDPSFLKEAPTLPDIWDEFVKFTRDSKFLLCSSAGADMNTIWQDVQRYSLEWQNRDYIDNVLLARKLFPTTKSCSLSAMCSYFATLQRPGHSALGDAQALLEVYLEEVEFARMTLQEKVCQMGIRTYR